MTFRQEAEKVLETFTLEELLEYSDITEEELVAYLLETGFITTPEVTEL